MSVIERAIDKLRRSAGTGIPAGVPAGVPGDSGSDVAPQKISAPPPPELPDVAREGLDSQHNKIAIDRVRLRDAGYFPEVAQARQFANYYRQIKRPLINAAAGEHASDARNPRLIMMTSALPGDGKTFTSVNLALSMAREHNASIILADADIARARLSQLFGLEGRPGLVDALMRDTVDVASLVIPTDIEGLWILPAGTRYEGATELLASTRMSRLASKLLQGNSGRFVIFDSSPLLVSSESSALAPIVGQIIMVVRALSTPRQAVLDAISQLGEEMPISLVINDARPTIARNYYYGGAYGGYGGESAIED
jgi:protein-tyrosine kinase